MNETNPTSNPADDGMIPNDPLTDHAYDGIQEFDNPMPGWWKMMFIGSIIYSVFYWMYYHNGVVQDRTVIAAYDSAKADLMEMQFAELGGELQPDRETILKYSTDPKWVKFGENVFKKNCTSCHGDNAGGRNGPNLTDEKWKHVNKVEDIAKVVTQGAAGNAMPSWQTKLNQNSIVLVSSYLLSIQGTVPANQAKAPIPGEVNLISDLAEPEASTEEATPPAE